MYLTCLLSPVLARDDPPAAISRYIVIGVFTMGTSSSSPLFVPGFPGSPTGSIAYVCFFRPCLLPCSVSRIIPQYYAVVLRFFSLHFHPSEPLAALPFIPVGPAPRWWLRARPPPPPGHSPAFPLTGACGVPVPQLVTGVTPIPRLILWCCVYCLLVSSGPALLRRGQAPPQLSSCEQLSVVTLLSLWLVPLPSRHLVWLPCVAQLCRTFLALSPHLAFPFRLCADLFGCSWPTRAPL